MSACALCTARWDTPRATLGTASCVPVLPVAALTQSPTTRGASGGCCGLKQHPNIVVAMESRHNPHHLLTAPPQLFAHSPFGPLHSPGTPCPRSGRRRLLCMASRSITGSCSHGGAAACGLLLPCRVLRVNQQRGELGSLWHPAASVCPGPCAEELQGKDGHRHPRG